MKKEKDMEAAKKTAAEMNDEALNEVSGGKMMQVTCGTDTQARYKNGDRVEFYFGKADGTQAKETGRITYSTYMMGKWQYMIESEALGAVGLPEEYIIRVL